MLLIMVFSLGLVGYRYNTANKKLNCKSITIYVNGHSQIDTIFFLAGQPLTFRSPITPGDQVIWNFGDGSSNGEGFSTVHTYKEGGTYRIVATINGICLYDDKKINIKKPEPVITDSMGNVTESIIGSDQGFVGNSFVFKSPLPATDYEWYIENNNNYPKRSGDSVTFKFRSEGNYIVVLILNHDRTKKYTKNITVAALAKTGGELIVPKLLIPKDKPETPLQAPAITDTMVKVHKKLKYATDEQFALYLQDVVCGSMAAKDFNDFLCQGENTSVKINNKGGKPFGAFCAEIAGKKIEIKSVVAARDNDNCVVNLAVTYEKRGRFAKHPCKD